jgi:hypothetical protein
MIQQTKTTERKNTFFSSSSSSLKQISDWLKWEKIARGRKQKKYLILFIFSKKYKSPPMDLVFFLSFPFCIYSPFLFCAQLSWSKKRKEKLFWGHHHHQQLHSVSFSVCPKSPFEIVVAQTLSLSLQQPKYFCRFYFKKVFEHFYSTVVNYLSKFRRGF